MAQDEERSRLSHWRLDLARLEARNFIKGVYLSPVALAVHLQLAKADSEYQAWSDTEKDTAKNTLKRLLVQVGLCALEAGYLVPVAGVVEMHEEQRTLLNEWERDQDWHRGQFLLFGVAAGEVEDRLVDILGPEPLQLPREFVLHTTEHVINKLRQRDDVPRELFQLLNETHQGFSAAASTPLSDRADVQSARRRQHVEQPFRRWLGRRLGEAIDEDDREPREFILREQQPADSTTGQDRISTERVVRRVTGLRVRNFRGLVCHNNGQPKVWNTEADVVLLAGPNGNGKSSFLEALLLALTGYYLHDKPSSPDGTAALPETLFSLVPSSVSGSSQDNQQTTRAPQFTIEATVAMTDADNAASGETITVDGDLLEGHLKIKQSWDGLWPLSVMRHWPGRSWRDERDYELDARLCGFFQEYVARLYDENVRGSTIRDVLEPKPLFFRIIEEVIDDPLYKMLDDKSAAEQRRAARYSAEQVQGIEERFAQWTVDFSAVYSRLRTQRPDWPEPFAERGSPEVLIQLCREVLARGGRTSREDGPELVWDVLQLFQDVYRQILGEMRRVHPDQIARYRELEELEAALEHIAQAFQHLDDELTWFTAADDSIDANAALPRRTLATLLRDLEHHVPRWLARAKQIAASSGQLHKLLPELEAVQTTVAGERAEELEVWLQPREQAATRRDALKQRLEALKSQLGAYIPPEELQGIGRARDDLEQRFEIVRSFYGVRQWQQDMQAQQARQARIDEAREELNILVKAIEEELGASQPLRETLQRAVNAVLGRFTMSEGLQHIVLEGHEEGQKDGGTRLLWRPRGAGEAGRGFQEFSTGQRSQVAIALMIAQYEMAQQLDLPGHRVLILDDVSTSYDLSNLSREALLWRQLAYHPNPQHRRQVFIASHHEDLTHHLLDLLAPPRHGEYPGTMRLLKFVGWDPGTGPEIREYNVRAPAGDTTPLESYKQVLERLLEENL